MAVSLTVVLGLLMALLCQASASDSLDFIYMSSYSTIESGDDYVYNGDDPYSSRITPDTTFPFGNSYVSSVYVSTNGYFSLGQTPEVYSLVNFPGPSSYSVVAPFAADITTSTTGSVRYSESFSSTVMNEVSTHIRSETGVYFYGTWMVVAQWNNVPLRYRSQYDINRFQGVLITDGYYSYAVFIYHCDSMEWGGGVIGWQASTSHYASYYLSGESNSNDVACANSYYSSYNTLVFRLDDNSPCSTFTCNNGRCVPNSYRCDGDNHCYDNSDEDGCPTTPTDGCDSYEFSCDNGQCVPDSYRCDGGNDCGDDSDEDGCGNCYSYQFSCDNGECVSDSYTCDGENDCGDNSDEDGCVNIGLAVGLSVGIFVLLLFIGLPICIFGIVFCVSANRRRPTVRTQVVSTTSGGTTVVAANQSATSAHVNPPPPQQQQTAYKGAPPSYTAAQQTRRNLVFPASGYQPVPQEDMGYPSYPPAAPVSMQAYPPPTQAIQQPDANINNTGYLLQQ